MAGSGGNASRDLLLTGFFPHNLHTHRPSIKPALIRIQTHIPLNFPVTGRRLDFSVINIKPDKLSTAERPLIRPIPFGKEACSIKLTLFLMKTWPRSFPGSTQSHTLQPTPSRVSAAGRGILLSFFFFYIQRKRRKGEPTRH